MCGRLHSFCIRPAAIVHRRARSSAPPEQRRRWCRALAWKIWRRGLGGERTRSLGAWKGEESVEEACGRERGEEERRRGHRKGAGWVGARVEAKGRGDGDRASASTAGKSECLNSTWWLPTYIASPITYPKDHFKLYHITNGPFHLQCTIRISLTCTLDHILWTSYIPLIPSFCSLRIYQPDIFSIFVLTLTSQSTALRHSRECKASIIHTIILFSKKDHELSCFLLYISFLRHLACLW